MLLSSQGTHIHTHTHTHMTELLVLFDRIHMHCGCFKHFNFAGKRRALGKIEKLECLPAFHILYGHSTDYKRVIYGYPFNCS